MNKGNGVNLLGRFRLGFRAGLLGRGKGGFREEDPNRKGSERVDVDVFSGDTVGERRVGGGNGFFGSGCNTVLIGGFVERGLDPILQTLFEKELEEYTV